MKVVYILKKGFQCYPPCLAQVLYLNDIGVDLTVYHGRNSDYIASLFEERGIENYTFESDKENKSNFQSYLNFVAYTREARKIVSMISRDTILWFGNCESAMTLGKRICGYRFVLTVLELYDPGSLYDKLVGRIVPYAEQIICCEKHRAVIMKDRYSLKNIPHVIPNKPYMLKNKEEKEVNGETILIKKRQNEKIIIYQGLVQPDRPIDNIALALKKLADEDLVFVIMGKAEKDYEKKIIGLYEHTLFLGYIPAPEHLRVTEQANIGIAIYDDSNLNNQFCAPNKIYEYAAFGIPMITSENLGLTETVGAYGAAKCVDFKNVDAVAEAIKCILDQYDEYSRNARRFYDSIDCGEIIKKVESLMET